MAKSCIVTKLADSEEVVNAIISASLRIDAGFANLLIVPVSSNGRI